MPRPSITSNDQTNEDAKVGYKHPPVTSQFRKGQSGNPRGRRKGQRNLAPVLTEILSQSVTVKQGGKSRRMSKGDALILTLMSKAQNGDGRAVKAMLYCVEKIARIDTPEPKLGGHRDYEFMLVPGMAASTEEWQREIDARHETAAIREMVAAARAAGISLTTTQRAFLRETVDAARAAGTLLTTTQMDAIRESLGVAPAANASRTVTRRKVNRIDKIPPKPAEQSNGDTATPPQTRADQTALPSVPGVARTGTYRKVNRQPPTSPTTTPKA